MDDKQQVFKEWLNKLQENSWNLELLVSGFAIFGLFQFNEFLQFQYYYVNANNTGDDIYYRLVSILLAMLITGSSIFIISLIVHVFLRGLWIGAIGLRFVSGDIDYGSLNYSDPFSKYIQKTVGEFDDFILKLENIASLMFAFTFLLFFISVSVIIWITGSSVLLQVLQNTFADRIPYSWYMPLFFTLLAIGGIVGFDFITLGLLKKVKAKWFARAYLTLYILVGVLTLSFLWRPLLFNFIDQKGTRRFVLLTFPLLLILSLLSSLQFTNYEVFPRLDNDDSQGLYQSIKLKENAGASFNYVFYDDLRQLRKAQKEYTPIRALSIPNYRIEDSQLQVFAKYDENLEQVLFQLDSTIMAFEKRGIRTLFFNKSNYDKMYADSLDELQRKYYSLREKDAKAAELLRIRFYEEKQTEYQANLSKILTLLREAITFEVNGRPIPRESVDFNFFVHPNLGEKGILCNFPIDTFAVNGTNYLTLNRLGFNENLDDFQQIDFTIPFVYSNQ
ncbi:hypothetical protein [Phaeodactylibacter sp.]|uniref:hypothetical protein n=1 Tax=Phaeodactylibacter sp. TaxID=1940289 RepID=UPI0025E30BFD|nr:hypothetical protein [Phaeodactylibacter sp.]MCI4650683.1 hypothetical protein [Phaeodactylibacter sp.]MCI5093515.1 hypothetical protein [Phaeodactylibacter sp.]